MSNCSLWFNHNCVISSSFLHSSTHSNQLSSAIIKENSQPNIQHSMELSIFDPTLFGYPCFSTHFQSCFYSWNSKLYYLWRPSSNSFVPCWDNSCYATFTHWFLLKFCSYTLALPLHQCAFLYFANSLCWICLIYNRHVEIIDTNMCAYIYVHICKYNLLTFCTQEIYIYVGVCTYTYK